MADTCVECEVSARSPYLTLPYGSRVMLRGDFEPPRCVCVSDPSDLELMLSAPSVGTVGRVVWTARGLGQEHPGGRRKVRLGTEAKQYAGKEILSGVRCDIQYLPVNT